MEKWQVVLSLTIFLVALVVVFCWTWNMRHTKSVSICLLKQGGREDSMYVVINLDHRPDRLKHCRKELAFLPAPFKRISAVDGKTKPGVDSSELITTYDTTANHRWDKAIPPYESREMSPGEIGCCMSHIHALRLAQQHAKQPLVVFEDDVVVFDHTRLLNIQPYIPGDADLFYFGYIDVGGIDHTQADAHGISPVKFCFGMFSYMILRPDKLLSMLPMSSPVDLWYGELIESGKIKAYAASPKICDQIAYGCNSDITHTGFGDAPRKC